MVDKASRLALREHTADALMTSALISSGRRSGSSSSSFKPVTDLSSLSSLSNLVREQATQLIQDGAVVFGNAALGGVVTTPRGGTQRRVAKNTEQLKAMCNQPKTTTAEHETFVDQRARETGPSTTAVHQAASRQPAPPTKPRTARGAQTERGPRRVPVPHFAVHGRRVAADELLLAKCKQKTHVSAGSTACLTKLLSAFRRADPGRTGFVDARRFRLALSEFLLGLTETQTDTFFRAYAGTGGHLDYDDFVRRIVYRDRTVDMSAGGNSTIAWGAPRPAAASKRATNAGNDDDDDDGDDENSNNMNVNDFSAFLQNQTRRNMHARLDPAPAEPATHGGGGALAVRRAFRLCDADRKGALTFDEFASAVEMLGYDHDMSVIRKLFAAHTKSGEVEMDFRGFLAAASGAANVRSTPPRELNATQLRLRLENRFGSVRSAFRTFDRNKTGRLEAQELADLLVDESGDDPDPRLVANLLREYNNGGGLTFNDLARMLDVNEVGFGTELEKASNRRKEERDAMHQAKAKEVARREAVARHARAPPELEAAVTSKLEQGSRAAASKFRRDVLKSLSGGGDATSVLRDALNNLGVEATNLELVALVRRYARPGGIDGRRFVDSVLPRDFLTARDALRQRLDSHAAERVIALEDVLDEEIGIDEHGYVDAVRAERACHDLGFAQAAKACVGEREVEVSRLLTVAQADANASARADADARAAAGESRGILENFMRRRAAPIRRKPESEYDPHVGASGVLAQLQDKITGLTQSNTGQGEFAAAHAFFGRFMGGARWLKHDDLFRRLEQLNVVCTARDRKALLRHLDPKNIGRISRNTLVDACLVRYGDEMYKPGSFMRGFKDSVKVDGKSLRRAFQQVDADRSGFLDAHELPMVCAAAHIDIDPEDLERIVQKCDEDGDGRISADEFAAMLRSSDITNIDLSQRNTTQRRKYNAEPRQNHVVDMDVVREDLTDTSGQSLLDDWRMARGENIHDTYVRMGGDGRRVPTPDHQLKTRAFFESNYPKSPPKKEDDGGPRYDAYHGVVKSRTREREERERETPWQKEQRRILTPRRRDHADVARAQAVASSFNNFRGGAFGGAVTPRGM